MYWALSLLSVAATAYLSVDSPLRGLVAGVLGVSVGAVIEGVKFLRRRRAIRHVLAGGPPPSEGTGDPILDRLMEAGRARPTEPGSEEWLQALSEWTEGRLDAAALGSGPVPDAIERLRIALVEDRERIREAAALLAETAERGQREFETPARHIEACAEALRHARDTVKNDVEALDGSFQALTALSARWQDEQADTVRAEEAAAWSRQRLERGLDAAVWGALDRDEEQVSTALHRLIGNLEREPEHPDRMVWLGQARGQVEALERHRASVHRACEDARRALLHWKSVPAPDRRELEAGLRRALETLRGLGEGWQEHTNRAEAAAAEAVAGMPDVEWWAGELARHQWELELKVAQGRSSDEFRARLETILQRQREAQSPGAASLARGLERLEARASEHAAELEAAIRRLERLSGSP